MNSLLDKLGNLAANLKPQHVFLALAFVFGLSYIIITPPLQVPDERNHFLKSYQISTGQLNGIKEMDRVGGKVPKALDTFTHSFRWMMGNMYVKTSRDSILKLTDLELDEDALVFVDFPSTGKYSFINYIPQAISIMILRRVTSKVFWIYYGAKFLTFLFWLTCITLAIRWMPFHKWLLTVLALLPMSVFINSTLSADVVTNAVAFMLIAYLLKLIHDTTPIKRKQILILGLLGVVLASTKIVYTPILLLFLLIPTTRFSSRSSQAFISGILLLVTIGSAVYWHQVMGSIYTPYAEYNAAFRDNLNIKPDVSLTAQLDFLLHNPGHIFTVISSSAGNAMEMAYYGYIGTFGWLDTHLPFLLVTIGYLVILAIAILEPAPVTFQFSKKKKTFFLLAFVITGCLMTLTLYLTWTKIGGEYIHIQGRYLIPFAPLLFVTLFTHRWNFPKLTPMLAIAFGILSLSVSYNSLYNRYYIEPEFEIEEFTCSAERISGDQFLTDHESILLGDAITQTSASTIMAFCPFLN